MLMVRIYSPSLVPTSVSGNVQSGNSRTPDTTTTVGLNYDYRTYRTSNGPNDRNGNLIPRLS